MAPSAIGVTTMPSNGHTNGRTKGKSRYDPNFTDSVIAATGSKAHLRLAAVMPSLLRHLHDFAREVDLTVAEWAAAVDMINRAGQMSDDKRNETGLICDVLGLESLVDEISSRLLLDSQSSSSGHEARMATPSAILGPFYRTDVPILPNGSSILRPNVPASWYKDAEPLLTHLTGQVFNATTGEPIPHAIVDIWHAGPNGLYEQQDDAAVEMNLRGRFQTQSPDGSFSIYCLRPTPYPIPDDGPAGELLGLLDRHPYRPAHIHFIVSAEGYRTVTTQVFDKDDKYVKDDAVFAVKKDLLVEFKPCQAESGKAHWELQFDFKLVEI